MNGFSNRPKVLKGAFDEMNFHQNKPLKNEVANKKLKDIKEIKP